jgi:hypothetical protein
MKSEMPNTHRVRTGRMASQDEIGANGLFMIPFVTDYGNRVTILAVISSDQEGWDHVSVSCQHRTPTWEEMNFIKDLFFTEEECVLQYHPPKEDYINVHNNVLHLWRQQGVTIVLPPKEMV